MEGGGGGCGDNGGKNTRGCIKKISFKSRPKYLMHLLTGLFMEVTAVTFTANTAAYESDRRVEDCVKTGSS